jgi:hypothetical protein
MPVQQLTVELVRALKKHFALQGQPPTAPRWDFELPPEERQAVPLPRGRREAAATLEATLRRYLAQARAAGFTGKTELSVPFEHGVLGGVELLVTEAHGEGAAGLPWLWGTLAVPNRFAALAGDHEAEPLRSLFRYVPPLRPLAGLLTEIRAALGTDTSGDTARLRRPFDTLEKARWYTETRLLIAPTAGRTGYEVRRCGLTLRPVPQPLLRALLRSAGVGRPLRFLPGAFVYRGVKIDLGGKPLAVLRALAGSRTGRCTCTDLMDSCWDHGDAEIGTVKVAVSAARKALRRAVKEAGQNCDDPLPTVDRGRDLAWSLTLP